MKAPSALNAMYGFIMILLLFISIFIITIKNTLQLLNETQTRKKYLFAAFVFCWSVISFSQVSTFIYFNF